MKHTFLILVAISALVVLTSSRGIPGNNIDDSLKVNVDGIEIYDGDLVDDENDPSTDPTEEPTTEESVESTTTPTGPTNTPTGPTNTPTGPTNTPTEPTNTPTEPTNTPTEPTNTPTGSTSDGTTSEQNTESTTDGDGGAAGLKSSFGIMTALIALVYLRL